MNDNYNDKNLSSDHYHEPESNDNHSKKPKKKKGFFGYIVVGLICSMLGGMVSAGATMYYYPKINPSLSNTDGIDDNSTTSGKITPTPTNYIPLSVSNIAKKVGPAVVGVATSVSSRDRFGFPSESGGFGSGIIFSEEGYILTNYHVVQGAKEISVIFNTSKNEEEKKEYEAKLLNYNEKLDVAVIKLVEDVKVPAVAKFGNSDNLQAGDPVIAIGNPLGQDFLGTVTSGVVSALNRKVTDENNNIQSYIQTDAAINNGNSGGALVNIYGEVIGVNSAKIGGSNVEGLGFAIAINDIEPLLQDLIKPIITIGVTISEINDALSKKYSLPIGIYIHEVEEFSPAEVAGLKSGDVIIEFDGKKISTSDELNEIKQSHEVGDEIEIKVYRNEEYKNLTLKLK
ncbi:trypsin-like peptidase domain-containing protein [Clostridium sediminicola]|uniref:S1C family serine protease n=1 Tax=Clostridium sediminicola TaxID=3114879 RepID=UPI0031F20277